MRNARVLFASVLALTVFAALAPAARADDSLIKIKEVYGDGVVANHSDFVELQLSVGGQQLAGGHSVRLYSPNGANFITLAFPDGIPVLDNQRTILLGWHDYPTLADPVANITFNGGLNPPLAGGAACLLASPPNVIPPNEAAIDCASWGTFSGNIPSAGTPAPALTNALSLNRTITPNCATLLEPADDSNNSLADFSLAAPSPRPAEVSPPEFGCDPPAPPPGATTSTSNLSSSGKTCKKKKKRAAASAKKRCKKKKK